MNQKDIYDIIIENTLKDWENSMNNQNKKELWEVPKYSKKKVDKAGKIIADSNSSTEEEKEALNILNN